MITAARYVELTGDTETVASAVNEAVADAVSELEEYLDRPLAHGERTERISPDRAGRIWPKATPLTDGGDYTIDGLALIGSWPYPSILNPDSQLEVTYTGGWADARLEDPVGSPLPLCIQRDLAWVAYRLLHPTAPGASVAPAGATSVRLGDAAVSYGPGGAPDGIGADTSAWWSSRTKRYRYAPISTPAGVS